MEHEVIDTITADTIEVGDNLIIDGDLVRVTAVDSDREDIDEVFVSVENLTGDDDSFVLFADDPYDVWIIS